MQDRPTKLPLAARFRQWGARVEGRGRVAAQVLLAAATLMFALLFLRQPAPEAGAGRLTVVLFVLALTGLPVFVARLMRLKYGAWIGLAALVPFFLVVNPIWHKVKTSFKDEKRGLETSSREMLEPARRARILLVTASQLTGPPTPERHRFVVANAVHASPDPRAALSAILTGSDAAAPFPAHDALGLEFDRRDFVTGVFGAPNVPSWYVSDFEIAAPYGSVADAVRWIDDVRSDRVFAHVHLSTAARGDDLARQLDTFAASGGIAVLSDLPPALPGGGAPAVSLDCPASVTWFFEDAHDVVREPDRVDTTAAVMPTLLAFLGSPLSHVRAHLPQHLAVAPALRDPPEFDGKTAPPAAVLTRHVASPDACECIRLTFAQGLWIELERPQLPHSDRVPARHESTLLQRHFVYADEVRLSEAVQALQPEVRAALRASRSGHVSGIVR